MSCFMSVSAPGAGLPHKKVSLPQHHAETGTIQISMRIDIAFYFEVMICSTRRSVSVMASRPIDVRL